MTKSIVISLALAQDLFDLLNQMIEYDDLGKPIDSDHSTMFEHLCDLECLIRRAKGLY